MRLVLVEMRKKKGFDILGAHTLGTFSHNVQRIVKKLLLNNGHNFGKSSVCVTCGDGAAMNENTLLPINMTSYNSAINYVKLDDENHKSCQYQIHADVAVGYRARGYYTLHILPALHD